MTTYVKHPTIAEDGEICIATANGPVTVKSVKGVFEWPDGVSVHRGFIEAGAPQELIDEQRRREREELLAKARELGLKIVDEEESTDTTGDSTSENATPDAIAQLEANVAAAQAALDADPGNEDLKKALTKAKTALTKAKKATE